MINAKTALCTIGDGYWSNKTKAVSIEGFVLNYINEEKDFGELLVFFNTKTWNTKKHGLIYTDSLFIEQLRNWLTKLGYNANSIEYSEQGMQGDNYVSLDVQEDFIASYIAKHEALVNELYEEMYS
jgi:hypothetical protein